jgi:hypothetical protein
MKKLAIAVSVVAIAGLVGCGEAEESQEAMTTEEGEAAIDDVVSDRAALLDRCEVAIETIYGEQANSDDRLSCEVAMDGVCSDMNVFQWVYTLECQTGVQTENCPVDGIRTCDENGENCESELTSENTLVDEGECRDAVGDMLPPENMEFHLPGTNWCGPGQGPGTSYDNLCVRDSTNTWAEIDGSCRRHDHCNMYIGLVNPSLSAIPTLACKCDYDIYTANADTGDTVGSYAASSVIRGVFHPNNAIWPCMNYEENGHCTLYLPYPCNCGWRGCSTCWYCANREAPAWAYYTVDKYNGSYMKDAHQGGGWPSQVGTAGQTYSPDSTGACDHNTSSVNVPCTTNASSCQSGSGTWSHN